MVLEGMLHWLNVPCTVSGAATEMNAEKTKWCILHNILPQIAQYTLVAGWVECYSQSPSEYFGVSLKVGGEYISF
mgnify:CR=1 FL=1